MSDIVDKATRSRMMSGIRGRDTKPEIIVRKYLHRSGLRFRLSPKDVFGRPDIVLRKYRVVVFVHGCFWHRHTDCKVATTPKSNVGFWLNKFDQNVARDKVVQTHLRKEGWKVIVVWACQINEKKLASVCDRIRNNIE